MGKTKWGLKPTSSSKVVGPKQKRLRRAKLSAEALQNYWGNTATARIVSVKRKILATLRKAGEYIYSSEILFRIAKFQDCLSNVRVKIRS